MINIVLPIAGRGTRFSEAGFGLPKPLIPVHGKPMIEVVVKNIRPVCKHRFIFVALKEHLDFLGMRETLERIAPGCIIVPVNEVTEGAACTVLLAREFIDNDAQLMIANSDQWIDININDYLSLMDDLDVDGLIMTMWADDPKWSFVGFNEDGHVSTVVEKEVISNDATVGIYNFRRGREFVRGAEQMIAKDLRVNGEFYVAPAYNELIASGHRICAYNIGREGAGMYGLGIPDDLEVFLNHPLSRSAAGLL
ncbi:glycosyltransferase family 2 protein [bacterium]|nr:glycosyltransferase family 2 protein [bacterium]